MSTIPPPKSLTPQDRDIVEAFLQFLKWADPLGPHVHLARDWYQGLLTIEEGQRIEQGRQVWQEVAV